MMMPYEFSFEFDQLYLLPVQFAGNTGVEMVRKQ